MILTAVRSVTLGQDAPPQPEVTRALLQAKTVYIISGHVRYYKTKGFLKKELVDETPFEERCRKELEKWRRFTLVPDIKGADLVIRAYEKGQTNYVPVISPGVTGSVNVGQSFFILDVWQPSSRKVIWSFLRPVRRVSKISSLAFTTVLSRPHITSVATSLPGPPSPSEAYGYPNTDSFV
jgi:hypothetical protein